MYLCLKLQTVPRGKWVKRVLKPPFWTARCDRIPTALESLLFLSISYSEFLYVTAPLVKDFIFIYFCCRTTEVYRSKDNCLIPMKFIRRSRQMKMLLYSENSIFCIKSDRSSSCSYTATVSRSSKATSSWERSAHMVKKHSEKTSQTINNEQHKYIERISSMHDPTVHVKTLEDEIRGTMGKALGSQASKILNYLKLMKQEREKYEALEQQIQMQTHSSSLLEMKQKLREIMIKHNEYHKEAHKARWELIVHRQAVGFLVRNHEIVYENYPIGDKIFEKEEGDQCRNNNIGETDEDHNFKTQLDWWQRIGRWR